MQRQISDVETESAPSAAQKAQKTYLLPIKRHNEVCRQNTTDVCYQELVLPPTE